MRHCCRTLGILLAFYPMHVTGQVTSAGADTVATSSSTIYLQTTFLGGNKYVENGIAYPAGASFGKLQRRLAEVPQAQILASEGSRIVTYGRLVSVVGAAIGISTFFAEGDLANYGLSIGGFIVAGTGSAIQIHGRNRINRAVWLYNEEARNSECRMQNSELQLGAEVGSEE